jgi:hypothetical protein
MTRKNTTISQGIVTDMMAALANLPKREKLPGDLLTLPEIFRSREYVAEIKGALKRGYSFDDLAEIFSERCGVGISARQIRYHFTHSQNLGKKNGAVPKANKKAEGLSPGTQAEELSNQLQ